VVKMEVSEQDHVDIARRVARAGEVAKQPAVRVLELVDTAARIDQHKLVARVDKDSVDLQSHRARRLECGCEQASCVLGPVAPQRFGWERERAVKASKGIRTYGADASALLECEYDPARPRTVGIPTMSADVLIAVLLTLPRPDWPPDQPPGRMLQRLGSAWR
jgi:hypothetical protein